MERICKSHLSWSATSLMMMSRNLVKSSVVVVPERGSINLLLLITVATGTDGADGASTVAFPIRSVLVDVASGEVCGVEELGTVVSRVMASTVATPIDCCMLVAAAPG